MRPAPGHPGFRAGRRRASGCAGRRARLLLAGPVALAFFSGGYFDGPRVWAGLGAWAWWPWPPWPRRARCRARGQPGGASSAWRCSRPGRWRSLTWAPLAGTAYHDGQRVFLYLGALVAATALLRGAAVRWVEPAVAAGPLVVVGYGLSERLVPWLVTLHHSRSSFGRLEQPLTYWNAMGEVAALG